MDEPHAIADMKNRLCEVFHRKPSIMSKTGKRRKLVLHFDVNKTIVPLDTATGESVEDALNVYLSGLVWGKDNGGEWECSKEELSNCPLERDSVSFYKFEERRLIRHVAEDRTFFRGHLKTFTDKPQGSNFKPYLNTLLQGLKWRYPYEENIHKYLTILGRNSSRYHFILPSFFQLLKHLVDDDRDFAIVLRTFGSDAESVLNIIRTSIRGAMPYCQNIKCMAQNVSECVLSLRRDTNTATYTVRPELANATGSASRTDNEMYEYLSSASGICAIHDDVQAWSQHNFHPSRGKPFWINLDDTETQHIFFDDNIRPGMEDSIVDMRVRTHTDTADDYRPVCRADEYQFVNSNLVPVDFSEAVLDEHYFVKKVENCEEGYVTLQQKFANGYN